MHVRILPPWRAACRGTFQVAAAPWRAQIGVEVSQSAISHGERRTIARQLEVGAGGQQDKGNRVEISAWIGDGAIAVDRKHPAGTAIGSTIIANHGCERPFCE